MARKRNCTCIYCLHRAAVKATNRDDLAQRILVARIHAWGANVIERDEAVGAAEHAYALADAMIKEGARPR